MVVDSMDGLDTAMNLCADLAMMGDALNVARGRARAIDRKLSILMDMYDSMTAKGVCVEQINVKAICDERVDV